MTQRLSTFWRALIFGSIAECALDGLIAKFGSGGPCGLSLVTLVGGLWHIPGMIFSYPILAMSHRPDNRDAFGYVAIGMIFVIGAFTFTALFYFLMKRSKS